jgi:nitrous oxidase accessory protein
MKKNALLGFILTLTLFLLGVARTSVCVDVVEASMVQEAAPDFSLTDIDGNSFSLSDYRGTVVLLEFFATYCSPCVNQTAHLKILYEEFGDKLLIISIGRENETVLRDFREEHGIEWTIANDTANMLEAYEVVAIPVLLIIDQQGYICYTYVGLTEESVLRPEIESLLPRTIYVDDDNVVGPWNGTLEHPYQNITSGLEGASVNDTIFVYAGTYYENVIVDKSLTLVGESKESTIVDGNRTGTVIKVIANNVAISGFTVQNSNSTPSTSYSGIKISGDGCNITGNNVTRNRIGVFVTSNESRIAGNIVTNNGHGISLYASSEVTVEANNVSANTVGISLPRSSHTMIVGNRVENSSTGGHGITLSNSSDNTILSNDLISNYHGMWLSSSFNNSILENTIANNELLGIELASSPNNTFYHNTFVNNPKHVVIDSKSKSTWDDGYPSGGNYWSDYEEKYPDAEEIDGSGIWDTPYVIDENNQDNYPIVPEFPSLIILSLFMMTTLFVVILFRRKSVKSRLKVLGNVS